MSPLCENYIQAEQLDQMEAFFPLCAYVCESCFLVQLDEFVSPMEIFKEYAYFSSYATSWVEHAAVYTRMVIERFGVDRTWQVVEVASNDGYLLQHFVERGIPALGIEPAANVAETAIARGIPTRVVFFGEAIAKEMVDEGILADLIIGNNVLAQVTNLNDFVSGLKILLNPKGIITMEFPHLMRLMEGNQFDTIYHEHFSYFSFRTAQRIFERRGITLFDVEELPTHGGSLRIFGRHSEETFAPVTIRVHELAERERQAGFDLLECYKQFAEQVKETKWAILEFLIDAKRCGKSIAGYGAPGKGNTLLNYCGIRADFLDYTVDRNLYKQGRFLPGTHIPIHHPDRIRETRPDYLFILPWNFKDEIMAQCAYIREWGGRFVVPIPKVLVC